MAGFCPQLDESAGKHRSTRIRKGAPDDTMLERIVLERMGDKDNLGELAKRAVERFAKVRRDYGDSLAKQPATAELLTWVRVLWRAGLAPKDVEHMPLAELYPGALLKTKADFDRVLGA